MKSKAPLLLMEQMVMLLVFALAAAICLQAFVKSDGLSGDSEARDRAVTLCQTAAEVVRHSGGNFNEAAETLGLEFGQGSTMFRYYDENWEPLPFSEGPIPGGGEGYHPAQEGAYRLTIQAVLGDAQPGLGKASVCVSEAEGKTLFRLEVCWQEPLPAAMGPVTEVEIDDGTAD